jgi:hypothetical protein
MKESCMTEDLVIGLKVLSAVHTGIIPWNCSDCDNNRQLQLACDAVSEILIWQHKDIGEFYSCPLRWITKPVLDWYDEYLYLKEFPGTAPKYGEHIRTFWEACKIYTKSFNDLQIEEVNKKQTDSKTTQSLASLKQGFKGKKK